MMVLATVAIKFFFFPVVMVFAVVVNGRLVVVFSVVVDVVFLVAWR